jgi:hypothetical protein
MLLHGIDGCYFGRVRIVTVPCVGETTSYFVRTADDGSAQVPAINASFSAMLICPTTFFNTVSAIAEDFKR